MFLTQLTFLEEPYFVRVDYSGKAMPACNDSAGYTEDL